jgi:hypothetical protein
MGDLARILEVRFRARNGILRFHMQIKRVIFFPKSIGGLLRNFRGLKARIWGRQRLIAKVFSEFGLRAFDDARSKERFWRSVRRGPG